MALHTGHRQRVKAKIARDGFETFADHEVLEALLFYAIPYRDTNPIAHALLARAGSLAAVPAMTAEQISAVPGCGEHVALFLHLFGEAGARGFSAAPGGEYFGSYEALRALAKRTVADTEEEETHLILFDNQFRLVESRLVFSGYYASAAFRAKLVAEPALLAHASMALLVTRHKSRIAHADGYETETSRYLAHSLSSVGVRLLEHFIVGGNLCMPVLRKEHATLEEPPHCGKLDTGGSTT